MYPAHYHFAVEYMTLYSMAHWVAARLARIHFVMHMFSPLGKPVPAHIYVALYQSGRATPRKEDCFPINTVCVDAMYAMPHGVDRVYWIGCTGFGCVLLQSH